MGSMKKSDASQSQSTSELVSKRIAEFGAWRGETLSRMRALIKEADLEIVEDVEAVDAYGEVHTPRQDNYGAPDNNMSSPSFGLNTNIGLGGCSSSAGSSRS